MRNTDHQYIHTLVKVLERGTKSEDRTGVGTVSLFGVQSRYDLSDNKIPAINVRKVAPRIAFEELMFMLNGKTQTNDLEYKQINIWKGNTSREFLDSRGLEHLDTGDMGRMYGAQLRGFNGIDYTVGDSDDVEVDSVDQLEYMINEIKNNPTSRRIISTHYNPAEVNQGVLFPCHIMTQFNVRNGKLDCLFWMRSSDYGFGLPYNIMYYGMFCTIMAKLCGLEPGQLLYQAGDAHLYTDQIDSGMVNYMIDNLSKAKLCPDPKFIIKKELSTLDDMLSLSWDDVEITNYHPLPDFYNKPKMAV